MNESWKDKLSREEGYYWWVDTVFGEPNNTLIEVRKVGDNWMKRIVNSTDWHVLCSGDGFKYFGPIEVPPYDFVIV